MSFDENDQLNANDQLDAAPIYPPASTTDSDAPVIETEASARTQRRGRVADREIPNRPVVDATTNATHDVRSALFEHDELDDFNHRWSEIQASFVDEPRSAVQHADALVSDVIAEIGKSFGTQRGQLEGQWARGSEVSTEDLRQIFQRYRSFFSRLLGL